MEITETTQHTSSDDEIKAAFAAEIKAERARPRGNEVGHTLADSLDAQGGIARRWARVARGNGHHQRAASLDAFADRHYGDMRSNDQ